MQYCNRMVGIDKGRQADQYCKLIYLVDGTAMMFPEALIEVETPHFIGHPTALCLQEPLYDVILGNIDGARPADNPRKEAARSLRKEEGKQQTVAAAITCSQAPAQLEKFNKLHMPETAAALPHQEMSMAVNKGKMRHSNSVLRTSAGSKHAEMRR